MAQGLFHIRYGEAAVSSAASSASRQLQEIEGTLRKVRNRLDDLPERSSRNNLSRASAFLIKKAKDLDERQHALEVLAQESNRFFMNVETTERRLASSIRMRSKAFQMINAIGSVNIAAAIGAVSAAGLLAGTVVGYVLKYVTDYALKPVEISRVIKDWLEGRLNDKRINKSSWQPHPISGGLQPVPDTINPLQDSLINPGYKKTMTVVSEEARANYYRSELEKMLENAPKPKDFSVIKRVKNMLFNLFHHKTKAELALLMGDYTDASISPIKQAQYQFNSFFNAYVPENYVPLSAEAIMQEIISGNQDVLNAVMSILNVVDAATDSIPDVAGSAGEIVSLTLDFAQENIQTINQLLLLQSMDKAQVNARADVYMRSSDPAMIAVGFAMKTLINSDLIGQCMLLTGKTMLSFSEDLLNSGIDYALETALNAALPGLGTGIMGGVGLVGFAVDQATGMGDYPELSNNLIYSVDTAADIYSVFQKDLKAYQSNPNDSSLNRVLDSYKAYENAVADMLQAEDAFDNVMSDSQISKAVEWFTGKPAESNKNADAIANHRDRANTADRLHTAYQHFQG